MPSLAEFQSAFADQLLSAHLATLSNRDMAAMTVYRNTVTKGFIDALAANYPTVLKLVGEEWFEAAALRFVRSAPATTPVLAEYGKGFAAFLEHFPPAKEIPYLCDVARIDWRWIESYTAPDAPALHAATLQALDGEQLLNTRLLLHPATRLCAVHHSALAIWSHNHASNVSPELIVSDTDEFGLITRRHDIEVLPLSSIEHEFVAHIEQGATLGEAAMTALADDAQFPLAGTLAKLITAGCFADL
ncbi:MAG TPA: DNA-binding domain-containing protein [Steroidobacteraceae bacterium]|nr:DNA-binding domain-containing protein [Steroidobacteraceae bacterium]